MLGVPAAGKVEPPSPALRVVKVFARQFLPTMLFIFKRSDGRIMTNGNEMPDAFVARRSEGFEIVLPRAAIERAARRLAEATNAACFHDAMELAWFRFDPGADREMLDCVSMLLTLYRSSLDGNVRPSLDLEELYGRAYSEMATEHGSLADERAPWYSPGHAGG